MDEKYKTVEMRVPLIAPFGIEMGPEGVQEVWDAYIKPSQDRGDLQSVEERALIAILRSVYHALGGEQ